MTAPAVSKNQVSATSLAADLPCALLRTGISNAVFPAHGPAA